MIDLRLKIAGSSLRLPRHASAMASIAAVAGLATSAVFAQSKPVADDSALLPFCTPGIALGKDLQHGLGLYEVGQGLFVTDYVDDAGAKNCLKGTPADLVLDLGGMPLNLTGQVQYESLAGPQRHLVATALSPVLCESYDNSLDQFAIKLTSANDEIQGAGGLLKGVHSFSYNLGTGAISPVLSQATYGPWLACYDATTANAASAVDTLDSVFRAGFENNVDLRVEYLDVGGTPVESLVQTVNTDIAYKVRVTNLGEVAAQNVRLREFLPTAGGTQTPTMSAVACVPEASAPPCVDARLPLAGVTIAPGASIAYTLSRRVAGSAPVSIENGALTSVAAFTDPSEVRESYDDDNTRRLKIGLNTLPTFPVSATVSGGGGTITPASQQVAQGSTATLNVTPSATYDVDAVSDNCGAGGISVGSLSGTEPTLSYSVPNITVGCAVVATFKLQQYTVTGNAGANGSIVIQTPLVSHGSNASFDITPGGGYSAAVSGTAGCGIVTAPAAGGAGTAGPITGSCALTASFSQNTYTVTPQVIGGNGTITPDTPQMRAHGGNIFFMLAPATNYRIASVTGCGGNLSGNNYLISSVTANCTVTAQFELITHTVTSASLDHGVISVTNSPVTHGQNALFTVVPNVGYHLVGSVTGPNCGTITSVGGNNWSAGPIEADGCVLNATFAINQYDVDISMVGGNGTIGDPPGTGPVSQVVDHGAAASVRVTPVLGYHPVFTLDSGSCVFADGDGNGLWDALNVVGDCDVTVSFAINQYSLTANLSTASPPNSAIVTVLTPLVNHGANGTVEFAIAANHHLVGVTHTCGNLVELDPGTPGNAGDPATYRTTNMTAACSFTADVAAD